MIDYQATAFSWAVSQGGLTGLVLFSLGIVYAFLGFRIYKFLLMLTCGAIGTLIGTVVGQVVSQPALVVALPVAAMMVILAASRQRAGLLLSTSGTFALLSHYFAAQLDLPPTAGLMVALVGGIVGGVLAHFSSKGMTVVMTTLNGTMLMIVGFVGMTSIAVPSLSETFRDWAASSAFVVPLLIVMLSVAGYSVQACSMRGDMRTGKI